jgi:signal transduction histidine kinase/CheY-like chemotaxis protein/sensor domain CHASE-containing protein
MVETSWFRSDRRRTARRRADTTPASPRPRDLGRLGFRYGLVALLAGIGVVLSIAAHRLAASWEEEREGRQIEAAAGDLVAALEDRLDNLFRALHSIRALYRARGTILREEFQAFAEVLIAQLPEVQALEWVPRVTAGERELFERLARMDGFADFRIHERDDGGRSLPAAGRDEHFPISLVVPMRGNEAVLGFDLGSDRARRAALATARDGAGIAVSEPIRPIREGVEQPGFLVFLAVYRGGDPGDDAVRRRALLHGFALGVVRADHLVDHVLGTHAAARDLNLQLLDDTTPPDRRLLAVRASDRRRDARVAASADAAGGIPHGEYSFSAGDRRWTLRFGRPVGGGLSGDAWLAPTVLVAGLLFTGMLAAYLSTLAGREASIARLVEARTRALAESEERLQAAIDNVPDGFVLYDADDRLVLANRRIRHMYPNSFDLFQPSVRFRDILRAGAERGEYANAAGRTEAWLAERLRMRGDKGCVLDQPLAGGRWIRVAETRLPGGGWAAVHTDISELVAAREDARAADRAKSLFLSNMSHELRTPLNAVLGFAQLLEFNPKEPLTAAQKSCVEHILAGGSHLLSLINEVLDLAKIEAGRMTVDVEDVSPAEVVRDCLAFVQPLADRRGIRIFLGRSLEDGVRVRADRMRLKQILLNLISNAVKYNRDGGIVTVDCRDAGEDLLRIAVTDGGPGIPVEKQKELFQPFRRLGAETTEIEGTGIGLVLAKQLVELLGGRIGFESTVGQGSTFWIDVGRAEAAPGAEAPRATGEGEPAAETRGESRPATLLYVEDHHANLKLMEAVARRIPGLALISAPTGELGLELAELRRPDAVLLDINLPGMDGFEVLRRLKASRRTRDIPVAALSSRATADDVAQGMAAGFDRYLTKPIKIEEVMGAIQAMLPGRG